MIVSALVAQLIGVMSGVVLYKFQTLEFFLALMAICCVPVLVAAAAFLRWHRLERDRQFQRDAIDRLRKLDLGDKR